jgi:aspartate-semialdehyde dehydrogenase
VTPIPNCTTTGLASSLAPIYKHLSVERLVMTSMQAMSSAGRRGGVLGLDAIDNVIPYIPGEEEKVQKEAQKILGKLVNGKIVQAGFSLSATCTRVAVLDALRLANMALNMWPFRTRAAKGAILVAELLQREGWL